MKLTFEKFAPWFGLLFGITVSCLLAVLFKENPWHIFKVLTTSFFNSKFDLGLTLFYTTCLIFSALSFSIPMKAGLFHIGSEGQIIFSALVAAYFGSLLTPFNNMPSVIFTFIIVCSVSILSGALAALVLAFFKIFRQAHEVVVAIMMNFIFAAITTWLTVNHLQNSESQNPETSPIVSSLQFLRNDVLKKFFDDSAVSLFLIAAIASCLVLAFFEKKTLIGYQIRAFGSNPAAAGRMNINSRFMLILSLGLAGVFSAMVGLTEVFGNTYQFKIGFSPQYGFLGIAVALLARQNFIGIIGSAFLMACLHKGASDLDLETEFLTRDFSRILQAIIIFSVAASYYFFNRKHNIKKATSKENSK